MRRPITYVPLAASCFLPASPEFSQRLEVAKLESSPHYWVERRVYMGEIVLSTPD